MKKIILFLLIFPAIIFCKKDTLRPNYGVSLFYNYNSHSADFIKLPYCPSCSPGFKDGSGSGFSMGLFYEYLINNDFALKLKLNYYNFSGLLTSTESTKLIVNNKITDGAFEHSIDTKLNSLGLEPYLKYQIIENLNLNIGFHIGSVIVKDYSQKEQIVKPSNVGTFVDSLGNDTQSRIRNQFSGKLENAPSIYLAPIISISYQLPLNESKTLLIEPEMSYVYGLSKVDNAPSVNSWSVNSFSGGINIKYSPIIPKEIIQKYEKYEFIDTVKILAEKNLDNVIRLGILNSSKTTEIFDDIKLTKETISRTDTLFYYVEPIRKLEVQITAFGVDKSGAETPNPEIKINEILSINLKPLLNYIFFDEDSSNLSDKYIRISNNIIDKFNEDTLHSLTAVETYYYVLNVFGKRLKNNPSSNITLIGCNDGNNNEKNNSTLSKDRAISVKKYLVDVWGLEDSRIRIETRNLPEKVSTPMAEPDKRAENRRVEIISDDYEITKPIYSKSSYWTIEPNILRFKSEIVSEAGIKNAKVDILQNKSIYKTYNISKFVENSDWDLSNQLSELIKLPDVIFYKLYVIDSLDKVKYTTERPISIIKETIKKKSLANKSDKTKEKYSLILFDFDKATLSKSNNKIIDLIKSNIKPESDIQIFGYADRTGDPAHNKILSEKRASAVEKIINHNGAKYQGIGNEKLLYNNDSPEGRFYSRTVEIEVETPIIY
jgi:outer membrane protein OmpA-like peptidoglycan-associated protein